MFGRLREFSFGRNRILSQCSRRNRAQRRRLLYHERLEFRQLLAGDIGGRVWHDTNLNGLFDNGETGLPGTFVELVRSTDSIRGNADDQVVAAAMTNEAGNYKFLDAAIASYYIRFLKQPEDGVGYRFAAMNAGTDDTIDSDTRTASGNSDVFALQRKAHKQPSTRD